MTVSISPKTIATEQERWQLIETAPKDGTHFLAANEESRVINISWYGKTSHVPLYGWCQGDDAEDIDLWHPTHWMALPAPPVTPAPCHFPLVLDDFEAFDNDWFFDIAGRGDEGLETGGVS